MSEDCPRAPRPDELDELLAQVGHVMRGEVGAAPTYAQDLPRIYCLDNLQNIRVIGVDGRIVSSAAIYPQETRIGEARLRIGGIGPFQQDLREAGDPRQRGIDLVGDTCREQSDGGHLFSDLQLLFELYTLGDVFEDHHCASYGIIRRTKLGHGCIHQQAPAGLCMPRHKRHPVQRRAGSPTPPGSA